MEDIGSTGEITYAATSVMYRVSGPADSWAARLADSLGAA
jgi:hypothetical protein